MIQKIRVRVSPRSGPDTQGDGTLQEVKRLGITSIHGISTARVYRLEGLTEDEAREFGKQALIENVTQESSVNAPLITRAAYVVEVAYKPGVMNPEVASIMKVARDLGIRNLRAVDSSTEYGFFGTMTQDEVNLVVEKLLVNKTVERVVTKEPKTLLITGERGRTKIVRIRSLANHYLLELSNERQLFLNLEEMLAIQEYFDFIDRDPFDAELETIAQTWSEHCQHKTFKARIRINGDIKPSLISRLRRGVERFPNGVISAFDDNSGVVRFFDGTAVCGKVETHNSPSALEPFGGAATGVGGVLRDIMGTGQGAQVIASVDIFCFAPPHLDLAKLPAGCLPPDYLLRHVVRGVQTYGNQMGVPTVNGSIHFDDDFRAKPTVIVGAYGIMPEVHAKKGTPEVGDLIVVIGGRTGRDGIHGATFSSGEMTERTVSVNASAVQIGNAIEEKRMSDAILACRDAGLIRAITDCGAGGFSSAIGEMGSELGVKVFLERAPLKYSGLAPWEIWVSESQERMVLAVQPEHLRHVLTICKELNVEATHLGEFTDDRRLLVTYEEEIVCDLDMAFLHDGLPERTLTAKVRRETFDEPYIPVPMGTQFVGHYRRVMAHLNVCSKEPIVRRYDHSVQGASALPPFSGLRHDGPNDAAVITPILGKPYGLVISHGLNPRLMRIDPYWGSVWALIEAIANLVAVGGNPKEMWLIDNFIWPFPNEEYLGALDRAVDACVDVMNAFEVPFVSGKDSLSSTYRGQDGVVINIPPVLCISAFGKIPDVAKTVTSDFKEVNSLIALVGDLHPLAMGGSVYYEACCGVTGNFIPRVDDLGAIVRRFVDLHDAIKSGLIRSCHDISEGGVGAALAEMCFGGDMGAEIDVSALGISSRPDNLFFNEMPGCFLLELDGEKVADLISIGLPFRIVGRTTAEKTIKLFEKSGSICTVSVDELQQEWKRPMKEVFPR